MNRIRKTTNTAFINKLMFVLLFIVILLIGTTVTAFANDTSDAIKNLADYIFEIAQVVGAIMGFFGLLQLAISLSSTHDATQRMAGILLIAGGAIIFFAEDILDIMGISV